MDLKSLTNLLKVSSLRAIICVYNCINCKSITCSDMLSCICIPYKAINLYSQVYRHTNLCRGKEQKHNLQEKQRFSSLWVFVCELGLCDYTHSVYLRMSSHTGYMCLHATYRYAYITTYVLRAGGCSWGRKLLSNPTT